MKIIYSRSLCKITCGEKTFPATNRVRNELNLDRQPDQVVYTIPDELPYYPRQFPIGIWNVGRPVPKKKDDVYLYPFFIPTDAWQMVDVWTASNGCYGEKTGKQVKDTGYGLHFSESSTTLGCIKIINKPDLLWLVAEINKELDNGGKVTLEVIE